MSVGLTPSDMTSLSYITFKSTDLALSVSAGYSHTCALFSTLSVTSGRIRCWGLGSSGRLGTDSTFSVGTNPTAMGSLDYITFSDTVSAVQVSAGNIHTCALFANGRTRCWGEGGSGELGYDSSFSLGDGPAVSSVTSISYVKLFCFLFEASL